MSVWTALSDFPTSGHPALLPEGPPLFTRSMLAECGKRMLRPGGMDTTRWMLTELEIGPQDDVVEFASESDAATRLALLREPRRYAAVGTSGPELPAGWASVVYGDPQLTARADAERRAIIGEAARLLRPGGRLGIEELALVKDGIDEQTGSRIRHELSESADQTLNPLTSAKWRELFEAQGFSVLVEYFVPANLLDPLRLIRDEGLFGAARFGMRALHRADARRRLHNLCNVYRRHGDSLAAMCLVAVRR